MSLIVHTQSAIFGGELTSRSTSWRHSSNSLEFSPISRTSSWCQTSCIACWTSDPEFRTKTKHISCCKSSFCCVPYWSSRQVGYRSKHLPNQFAITCAQTVPVLIDIMKCAPSCGSIKSGTPSFAICFFFDCPIGSDCILNIGWICYILDTSKLAVDIPTICSLCLTNEAHPHPRRRIRVRTRYLFGNWTHLPTELFRARNCGVWGLDQLPTTGSSRTPTINITE
jgi:hypothetical protein